MYLDIAEQVEITPDEIAEDGCVVLGSKRSGKSNTVALLVESLIPHFPFAIADAHDEYWGLREKFPLLIVGHTKSKMADLRIAPEQAAAVAEFAYTNRRSVLLELLMFEEDERELLMMGFFSRLWDLAIEQRKSFGIVLEEAQNVVPEGMVKSPLLKKMKQIVLEGGKFGLGIILATQTTTEISKTVLKQMRIRILHRVNDYSDIQRYQTNTPLPPKEVEAIVRDLAQGEAIFVRGSQTQRVMVRKRETFHVGSTPLVNTTPPPLQPIDAAMLEQLQASLQPADKVEASNGAPDHRDRVIADLRRQVAAGPKVERIEVPVLTDEQAARLDDLCRQQADMAVQLAIFMEAVGTVLRPFQAPISDEEDQEMPEPAVHHPAAMKSRPVPAAAPADTPAHQGLLTSSSNLLNILARHHPTRLTINQLAALADYSPSGGAFRSAIKQLRDLELIVQADGLISLSEEGARQTGARTLHDLSPTEILAIWINVLPTPAPRLLAHLVSLYPRRATTESLAEALNYSPKGGAFRTGLKLLRDNGLIDVDRDRLRAAEMFFEERVNS